jgi:uncharacterized protein
MLQKVVILAPLPHCGNFAIASEPTSTRARRAHDRTMKLYQDNNANTNVVTGYGDDHVMISRVRHDGNVLVSASRVITDWAPQAAGDLSGLQAEDLAVARELGAEILIVGTGRRQRFPQPQLLRPLIESRIGFEFMDFPAACRTYNILVAEGRAVVLGLLYER